MEAIKPSTAAEILSSHNVLYGVTQEDAAFPLDIVPKQDKCEAVVFTDGKRLVTVHWTKMLANPDLPSIPVGAEFMQIEVSWNDVANKTVSLPGKTVRYSLTRDGEMIGVQATTPDAKGLTQEYDIVRTHDGSAWLRHSKWQRQVRSASAQDVISRRAVMQLLPCRATDDFLSEGEMAPSVMPSAEPAKQLLAFIDTVERGYVPSRVVVDRPLPLSEIILAVEGVRDSLGQSCMAMAHRPVSTAKPVAQVLYE